jgi:UDP-GlcNAc:undecaprenyl-phosphate/decaprenyl-phosphate GlcNAc-1-phosphate transferase
VTAFIGLRSIAAAHNPRRLGILWSVTTPTVVSAPAAVAALGVLAAALAVPLTAMLIRLGHRAGALDSAGVAGHFKELRRVPNIGGIAMAAAIGVPLAGGLGMASLLDANRLEQLAPALVSSVQRLPDTLRPAWAILLGMVAMHVVGLVDDRRALPALPKLLAQVVIAAAVVLVGDIRALTLLDGYPGGFALSTALTTLWIVALCNSVNFLDNMDGLAGGVAAIGALCLCLAASLAHQWLTAGLLALLVGALAGFLVFNAPWTARRTARIFMGDGGSLMVGFLLAVLSVRIVFVNPSEPGYALGTAWYGVLAPLVILAVPLYDTTVVTVLRLSQGRRPWIGDDQHFSHRLVLRGLSRRGAVLVLWALAAICGVSGLLLGTSAPWQAVLIAVQVALVLGTLAGLERPMLQQLHTDGPPDPSRTRPRP